MRERRLRSSGSSFFSNAPSVMLAPKKIVNRKIGTNKISINSSVVAWEISSTLKMERSVIRKIKGSAAITEQKNFSQEFFPFLPRSNSSPKIVSNPFVPPRYQCIPNHDTRTPKTIQGKKKRKTIILSGIISDLGFNSSDFRLQQYKKSEFYQNRFQLVLKICSPTHKI